MKCQKMPKMKFRIRIRHWNYNNSNIYYLKEHNVFDIVNEL